MRLSLPARIPLSYLSLFAALVFVLQQVDHTALYFSIYSALFILISGLAFNTAGGLTTPSGGYIFFFSFLSLVLGLLVKIYLGEPGEANLFSPELTIRIYVGGISAMLFSALVARRFTRREALLANTTNMGNMQSAATGCLVIGGALFILSRVVYAAPGSIMSILQQVNHFPELAILLGVTYQIRKTGGRSSINTAVIGASALIWINGGLLGYSKQALFTPPICWAVAAAAQQYKLSRYQVVGSLLLFGFLVRFMVPYSQYGRNQASESARDNIRISMRMLSNLEDVRVRYNQQAAIDDQGGSHMFFDKPQGLFDRLQMIYVDSMLFDATERNGAIGLSPLKSEFANVVPHILWPGKPYVLWGNVYAHDAGVPIGEEDLTTGVSFTPVAEAYHMAKWTGLLGIAPVLWIVCFAWLDSLCGDVRQSPWGLLVIILFSHVAPEGLLAGVIWAIGYGAFSVIFAALTAAYVMPIIGSLVAGRSRGTRMPPRVVTGLPRRVSAMSEPEPTGI